VDDLHLEVRGVGDLVLPVTEDQARQLFLLGRPARFGRGEHTLLDRRVRDTQEIPRSRIKIDKRRWARTLQPVLDQVRHDLGLPPSCELRADLHSMLVYARGQFFVPHQDSEKADGMVGSLVVTLPSSHKGGALVVEHAGRAATYRPAKGRLSFVAFYSDCRHQVKPVTAGHRIVLTYNLLVRGDTAPLSSDPIAPKLAGELAGRIAEHFGDEEPPKRLVYLLDHEYTEHGLSWARLKGADASRAALLRAAADQVDCEFALALADVHQTWSAFESGWDDRRYGSGRYRRWDDRDDDDPDEDGGAASSDDYELDDLIDSSTRLDCWIDEPGSRAAKISLDVGDDEVCATIESDELVPYASEYEGYMGNYGNTLDRWYRRAAVVLWPRQQAFAVRAEASPEWALDTLASRLESGDVAGALAGAEALEPFWNSVASGEHERGFFARALEVARQLGEPVIAANLLAPFHVEMLRPGNAASLARLVERYGEQWARDLIRSWSGRAVHRSSADRPAWLASLPRLCEALQGRGDPGASAAQLLAAGSWRWLTEEIRRGHATTSLSVRVQELGRLGAPFTHVLEAISVVGAADLRDEAVGFAREGGGDLVACLMPALRAAAKLAPDRRTASGLDAIADHCAGQLTARLDRPARAAGDWSVGPPGGCSCELCKTLGDFLGDPARRSYEWPLREDGRRHVHGRIDLAELPVTHRTRRTGRPYTLVLTKTEALFERERQARRRDEDDLAWLDKVWPSGR
jgi:hypothetical protein